jgi:hypothetical protein
MAPKQKAGDGDSDLVERKKALEKELHQVEERIAAQQREAVQEAIGVGPKKGKKEKVARVKAEKKAKAPKAHPSSKAGPGFTVALTDDSQVVVANINKKGHSYKMCGLREGDVFVRIDEQDVNNMNLNDIKAKLVAKCGTVVHLDLTRPAAASAAGTATFAAWLANAHSMQETSYAGPYSADVILEFGSLVKSIKSGKPAQRGESAELSLKMADSQVKRELFFVAGALQPLCKLLTGTNSLHTVPYLRLPWARAIVTDLRGFLQTPRPRHKSTAASKLCKICCASPCGMSSLSLLGE